MPDLKPCPFCGESPYIKAFRFGAEQFDRYVIGCQNCGYSMPPDDPVEKVAEKWNRRADNV